MKHTFDVRNEITVKEMRKTHELNLADNRTVYCIKCRKYIKNDHLDDECGE